MFSAINAIRPPKSQPLKPQPAAVARLAKFLEPEIKEGLLTVDDQADRSIIVLKGDGMFDSGKTVVLPRYVPVIERVANALNSVSGSVTISGHTDNVPMRGIRSIPSNYELSQLRAEAVRSMIDPRLTAKDRTRSQGQAESMPIESNATAEGRAKNRRVEVTLLVPPSERDRELNAVGAGAVQGKQ